jgi:hypothetical protein
MRVYELWWSRTVPGYGTKKLTFSEDKLIAISGVAKEFPNKLQEEYVAGLWAGDLISGLCWFAMGGSTIVRETEESGDEVNELEIPSQDQDSDPTNTTRPTHISPTKSYIAPSWSWASLNTMVINASPYNVTIPWATIITYDVVPTNNNPLGRISSAYIRPSGYLNEGSSPSTPPINSSPYLTVPHSASR